MPNRSELAPVARAKTAVANTGSFYDGNTNPSSRSETDGLFLVTALCMIGALISIDFAAYFEVLDKLPLLVTQIP